MMFGIGLLKGMRVTLRRCFSKPNTVQYPEERLPVGPMFRGGTIDLNLDKCIACGLCAMACPNQAIELATEKNEGGKKVMAKYRHHIPVCLYCNYCIEACPVQAIHWTANYEISSLRHEDLIVDCMAGHGGERA
jgi:NADH-quinone oxidoreductase subunit I